MGGDGKRQPQCHAARVALHRGVDELGHVGEVDDVVELPVDLVAAHAQDGAIEVDVLAAGQIRMKSGAHFQQTRHPAVDHGRPPRRLRDSRQNLQQRRFAGAVGADDPDRLSALDLEGHVPQRPDRVVVLLGFRKRGQIPQTTKIRQGPASEIQDRAPEGVLPLLLGADSVPLRQLVHGD